MKEIKNNDTKKKVKFRLLRPLIILQSRLWLLDTAKHETEIAQSVDCFSSPLRFFL